MNVNDIRETCTCMIVFSYNELKIDGKHDGCYNQKCNNKTSKTSFQHIHVRANLLGLADDVLCI